MLKYEKCYKKLDKGCHSTFLLTIKIDNELVYICDEIYSREKGCRHKSKTKNLLKYSYQLITEFSKKHNILVKDVFLCVNCALLNQIPDDSVKVYFYIKDDIEYEISEQEFYKIL